MLRNLSRLIDVVSSPGAMHALLTWPRFSISSYELVHRLVQQKISARTVLDVGANIGQFAVAAAKLFPKSCIHSFEPQPTCLRSLQRIADRLPGIVVYPIGLGDAPAFLDMRINSHSHSSSLLSISRRHIEAFPKAREAGITQIEVSTLDKVMHGKVLEEPILLKIDVQGFEDRVLAGAVAILEKIDYVVLETSFMPLYEGERTFLEMLDVMTGYGFSFVRPVGFLANPKTGEILQCDALFRNQQRLKE